MSIAVARLRSVGRFTAIAVTLALISASCGSGSESSGAPTGTDASSTTRMRNGNVTDADGFGDLQTALSTATSFLKREAPKWDPQAEIAKLKCTPSNQKFELINPSLNGCVYTDAAPWVDYKNLKSSKRTDAIKADYLGWGYQLWKWPRSFKSHNLAGATFKDIDLSKYQKIADPQYNSGAVGVNADFSDATFKGSTFTNAKVGGNFVNAKFSGFNVKSLGDLTTSYMEGADYSGTDLSGITLPYSQIGSNFNGANAAGITIPGALLNSSTGVKANFTKAKLAGAQIGGPTLAIWPSALGVFRTGKPTDADYSGADFSGADLSGANLQYVNFTNAKFVGANLTNAKLDSANFTGADLTGADLSGTTLNCLSSCTTANPALTRFDGATLSGAKLVGASGTQTSFSKTTMIATNFTSATLVRADFSMSTISGSVFRQAKLSGAQLRNVNGDCTNEGVCTDFSEVDTRRSDSKAVRTSFDTVTSDTYTGKGTLRGAYFTNANLGDTTFYGMDLSGASFTCTRLESTTMTDNNVVKGAVWASPTTDTNSSILIDQTALSKKTVSCPATSGVMSLLQDDANFKLTGKRLYTTTTTSTTTTIVGTPVAVVNPTFTAGQGGWNLISTSTGARCGSGGKDPSLGEFSPNSLFFGQSQASVEQKVVVPKAGLTRLSVYATVTSDYAMASVVLIDGDENNSSKTLISPLNRQFVTVSVTTTQPNETVTISLRGSYATRAADNTCTGAKFENISLVSA